MSLSKEC